MPPSLAHNRVAHLIAFGGSLIVVVELTLHWILDRPIGGLVVAIGSGFGFIGAYMSDRKGALEGGGFLVDSATRIIQVVRSGRRSTDSKVIVETPVEVVTPPSDTGE